MNKITKYFYEREKKNELQESEKNGLQVVDEEKFEKRIMTLTKNRLIYTVILCLIVGVIIYQWVV